MDPDAALATMRRLCDATLADQPRPSGDERWLWEHAERAVVMAETFRALDGWLSRQGFPPGDWRQR